MRDTLPFLVFISLERKEDPCKSDCSTFTLFKKFHDALPFLVFKSLERKDDPWKSDCPKFYPCWKYELYLTPLSVYFIREEGRPL